MRPCWQQPRPRQSSFGGGIWEAVQVSSRQQVKQEAETGSSSKATREEGRTDVRDRPPACGWKASLGGWES